MASITARSGTREPADVDLSASEASQASATPRSDWKTVSHCETKLTFRIKPRHRAAHSRHFKATYSDMISASAVDKDAIVVKIGAINSAADVLAILRRIL